MDVARVWGAGRELHVHADRPDRSIGPVHEDELIVTWRGSTPERRRAVRADKVACAREVGLGLLRAKQVRMTQETPRRPTLRMSSATPSEALDPGDAVGDWTIRGTLGAGGMATVYEADDASGRRVAIKIAHSGLFDDGDYTTEMFLREARIAGALSHPNVVGVRGTGMHDDGVGHVRPYVLLELLRGTSLGARLDAGTPLPRPVACELLLELVDVLRAAHAAGITHRDLKPDNVFLLAPRGERRLKLLDWGVAHVAGEDDPFRGMIAGTLTYVAPEQIRGDELTPAADIYSLGVLAYRMLCMRPPFAAASDLQLLKLHLHAPPPHARAGWSKIPETLDELLVAMLAKDPNQRPSLDDIERVISSVLAELEPRRLARGTQPQEVYTPPHRLQTAPTVTQSRSRWTDVALGLARATNLFTMLW
jgi:eukaryotic-like serine/threonine-protein kinase